MESRDGFLLMFFVVCGEVVGEFVIVDFLYVFDVFLW